MILSELLVSRVRVIIESVLSWGSVSKVNSEVDLHALSQYMRRRVPEDSSAFFVGEGVELEFAVSF